MKDEALQEPVRVMDICCAAPRRVPEEGAPAGHRAMIHFGATTLGELEESMGGKIDLYYHRPG